MQVNIGDTIVLDDAAEGDTIEQLLSIGSIALAEPVPAPDGPASEQDATASQGAADTQQKGKRGK